MRLSNPFQRARRFFVYTPVEPIAYWRWKSTFEGTRAVMFLNRAYNTEAHRDQWETIMKWLPDRRESVLDLGCGIGRMSEELAGIFSTYSGVDLLPMIAKARLLHPRLAAHYTEADVLKYEPAHDSHDLILSMACLGNACPAEDLPHVAAALVKGLRPGGRIILLDAFHRLPVLTRICRLTPREAIGLFENAGATLVTWSGIHCIPFRFCLARAGWDSRARLTALAYRLGKRVNQLAPRVLSDYSLIVLTK